MKPKLALSILAVVVIVGTADADARQVFRSPDGSLVATVIASKQKIYGINPSRIEIRDRKGHLLAERDHTFFPSQGLTVETGAWTKNSAFFVYSAEQSGGHQPWAHPTFVYSRRKKHFYSLDRVLDSPISGPFTLKAPQTLVTEVTKFGTPPQGVLVKDKGDGSGDKILTVKLNQLSARMNEETLSSDRKDHVSKRAQHRS